LNKLIISNNDRIKGYLAAAKETEEQDLKSLFTQLITTSQKCNQELIKEVKKLGGEIIEEKIYIGNFLCLWIDVIKAALLCNDRKVILKSFEYGESTVETYYRG
jgi:uncharacterized protein (TIGR02284 family)